MAEHPNFGRRSSPITTLFPGGPIFSDYAPVTDGKIFVFIVLFLCFVGSDKTLQKSEMMRSKGKHKSLKKFHKHHSEETLKVVNGESINVPVDQYRRLVKAQEVIFQVM